MTVASFYLIFVQISNDRYQKIYILYSFQNFTKINGHHQLQREFLYLCKCSIDLKLYVISVL